MAVTATPTTLEIQKWRTSFWKEYQRENLFAPYIGTGTDAIIQRVYELKDEGEQITIPILGRLTGQGQVGANTLTGNEESLDQYGFKIQIDWARHAVLLNKKEIRKSPVDQLATVKPWLMTWAATKLRDDICRTFNTIGVSGSAYSLSGNVYGIPYALATAAQKNAWSDANADRIQYGNSAANLVAGNHAASLANVDTTNDLLTVANLKTMKRRIKQADPHISPIRVEDGREYFMVFAPSGPFADLSNDQQMLSANLYARPREGNGVGKNPIFQDGDLEINGIIIREIPEGAAFWKINGAGTAGANVYPVFFCGQQALGYAVGQLPAPTTRNDDDYGFLKGRGIETCYGMAKVAKQRNSISTGGIPANTLADWGMGTMFVASVSE